MDLKQFLKQETSGWNKGEVLTIALIWLFVSINAFVTKDSLIAFVSAICGITYTYIAGKGKVSCYLFGVTGSGFYCYLSFINALWGNLLLYALYYIPMQILGFLRWSKHINAETNTIVKIKLSNKHRLILFGITSVLTLIAIYVLKVFNDTHPIIDGITTVFSIAGMYLTVKRAIEQWIVWMIVNALASIMWINIVIGGEKAYSTVIMWITYFILAIYFYIKWRREIKQE